MEFNGHIFCAGSFQNGNGLIVFIVINFGVSGVRCDDNIMLFSFGNQLCVEFRCCGRRCGVVGVVYKEYFALIPFSSEIASSSGEVILFEQRNNLNFTAGKAGCYRVNRIVGRSYQHEIAGVNKSQWEVRNTFFGTDEGNNFFCCVQLNIKSFLIPVSNSLTESQQANIRRVLVVNRVLGCFVQCFNNKVGSRKVRIANAEADDIYSLSCYFSFESVNFSKEIRGSVASLSASLNSGISVCSCHFWLNYYQNSLNVLVCSVNHLEHSRSYV